MATPLPILQPTPIFQKKDYREVLKREMDAGKIPLSLGRDCPVKCEFCYELDHSYRETLDPPKTTDEDWKYILDYISRKPTDPKQFWVLGGNEYMEWTDLFLHPKAMEWVEDFLKYTDKNIQFFTVGFVHVPKIHQLVAQYPGRINFELSVITLSDYRQRLMPHAPSVKHLMKVLDGPAVSSANFYAFDTHTMSKDAVAISAVNKQCVLWMGTLTPVRGLKEETANLMRQGRKYLAEEAIRIYDAALPNLQTIHTEAYITAFLSRRRIVSLFDSLELEKKDSVVMAWSVYKILTTYRKNRARFLYVPNAMLSGDSDCTVLLTFDDIARRLTNEKVVHIPKCVMQSGRGLYTDITGVTLEQFMKKTGVKVKVLHKIDTRFANNQLYRNGSLQNYVENYVRNPMTQSFESLPRPA
ncbi:MAG TPA: radical SAM protein [Nitrospira sp.]|nr:radical SAM protein [Nitrospira sp.]